MTGLTPPTPSPEPIPDAEGPPLGPIAEPQRIVTLDVLRGFALFGIFMVNMQFFALPFAEFVAPKAFDDGPVTERLAWAFVKFLFEYKFISLFSLLFGVGLVIQMARAEARGRRFAPVFLRRLVVLALMGLVHGLLLWYGDILFIYACVGTILLLCRRARAKYLLIAAGAIVALVLTLQIAFLGVMLVFADALELSDGSSPPAVTVPSDEPASEDSPAAELEVAPADDDAAGGEVATEAPQESDLAWSERNPELAERFPWLAVMIDSEFNMVGDTWLDAETAAYETGPFTDALGFRGVTYVLVVVAAVLSYGWRALSMFFLGAALMKLQFFLPARRVWHRRLCVWGLGIGLPLELAFTSLAYFGTSEGKFAPTMLGGLLHEVGSYAMCLGLVGGMTLLVSSGAMRWLTGAMACVGRLALSNYLLQTVVSTSIMYWWGLAWFGDVTRVQQLGLVLLIYAAQLVASVIYLRFFTIGPLEWLWRTVTYMRPQPILRRVTAARSEIV